MREPEETVGKSVFDFFPYEIAAEYSRDLKEVFRTGQSDLALEKDDCSRKGEWIISNLNPVKSPEGKVAQ